MRLRNGMRPRDCDACEIPSLVVTRRMVNRENWDGRGAHLQRDYRLGTPGSQRKVAKRMRAVGEEGRVEGAETAAWGMTKCN